MGNEFLKMINTRRSCRKYRKEQITDEELNAILEAGTYAPTGMGQQSPYIVAVQNPEMKAQLERMNAAVRGLSGNPYYDGSYLYIGICPAGLPVRYPRRHLCVGKHDVGSPCLRREQLLD